MSTVFHIVLSIFPILWAVCASVHLSLTPPCFQFINSQRHLVSFLVSQPWGVYCVFFDISFLDLSAFFFELWIDVFCQFENSLSLSRPVLFLPHCLSLFFWTSSYTLNLWSLSNVSLKHCFYFSPFSSLTLSFFIFPRDLFPILETLHIFYLSPNKFFIGYIS